MHRGIGVCLAGLVSAVALAAPAAATVPGTPAELAFVKKNGGHQDIFVTTASGTGLVNLTNTPGSDEIDPDWSPNGRQLAFWSDRNGLRRIYVLNAETGKTKMLT